DFIISDPQLQFLALANQPLMADQYVEELLKDPYHMTGVAANPTADRWRVSFSDVTPLRFNMSTANWTSVDLKLALGAPFNISLNGDIGGFAYGPGSGVPSGMEG